MKMRFGGNGASFVRIPGKGGFFCGEANVISVTVHTILDIKRVLGQREVDFILPQGSNIHDLLACMVEKWGEALSSRLFDPKTAKLFPYIQVMVNGRSISFLNGMETVLEDQDDVLILPPAGGG